LAVSRFLDAGDRTSGPISRASPAPGSGQTMSVAFSTGRSGSSSVHRNPRQAGSQMAENYLSGLNLLLSAPHAPFRERAKEVSSIALQVLQARHAKLNTVHQVAFATINSVLSYIQADNVSLAKSLARDLVPLITHWWPPRALLRDAMSNAIRDEMLKTLYGIHLFLESLMQETSQGSLLQDLEDLLDALWSEYSKREDRARLQLDDLTFTSMRLPEDHPGTNIFRLRPYNQPAEQNWALLESLANLEALYSRNLQRSRAQQSPEEEQPRKRRRVAREPNRIQQKLTSLDPGVRLTALQLFPFLSQQQDFSVDEVTECLEVLLSLISDKQAIVASWAMLACSRYVLRSGMQTCANPTAPALRLSNRGKTMPFLACGSRPGKLASDL
jgi:ataxia telangiectasia mutated family protein